MPREELRRTTRLLVWIACAVVHGCAPSTPGTPGPAVSPVMTPSSRPLRLITPIDFFPPEQKRLSQHLNWETGCFQINYSGPEKYIGSRMEVWQKGKPDGNNGYSTSQAHDNEISIVVREDRKPGTYRVTKVVSSRTSSSSSTITMSRPELGTWGSYTAKIPGPLELVPGQEVAVWALMHFKSIPGKERASAGPTTPVAEQAKEADWAIVLKVVLDPPRQK